MTTPAPWDSTSQLPQSMRLHPHAPSKALRGDNTGRCLFCYNRIWWFDRADGGRIPLLPKEFPTRRVPPSARWSVDAGLARPGAVGDSCWIPHPVVCPGIEHDEFKDPGLADLYRQSSLNMQAAIREGRFSAPLLETEDEETAAETPSRLPCQDVIAYHSVYLVVPTTVDQLLCVAQSHASGERCTNPVVDPHAIYQGEWAEQPVPHPRRPGGPGLWEGQTMWVWSLNATSYQESVRWRSQRCPAHGTGSTAPDASPRECEHFDAIRHGHCIRHTRPVTSPAGAVPELRQTQHIRCAGQGCLNGKAGRVAEHELVPGVGWLCWRCRPKHTQRRITHRRWQADPEC